jgi:hypothetical protein
MNALISCAVWNILMVPRAAAANGFILISAYNIVEQALLLILPKRMELQLPKGSVSDDESYLRTYVRVPGFHMHVA